MSKVVENIYKIHNNPFIFTPLIIKFYEKYFGQEKDVLLSYLILPLVLHEDTKLWLCKANVRSSLHTFGAKKENFFGLPKRIVEYRDVTNKCLQNALNKKMIVINDNLSVQVIDSNSHCEASLKKSLKASANITKILKSLDVVAIYRLLGVKKL